MKKAQLAVETLLIYGIAILIVMLAIGALISFGVLDLGTLLPDTCSIQGAPLNCEEYFLSKTEGLNMELTNNLGKNLETLTIVRVRPSNTNDVGLLPSAQGTCVPGEGDTFLTNFMVGANEVSATSPLLNGERAYVTSSTCVPVAQLKAGKKLSLDFEIEYKAVGSNLPRKATGKMRVTVVE